MPAFRTEIQLPASSFRISHNTPLLFTGSCFTENIGIRLEELLFPVLINPCGIVYNPSSVKRSLELLAGEKIFTEADIDLYNELYFSFDHDTSFSHTEKMSCIKNINSAIEKGSVHLKKASYLLITFGTAWVYFHKGIKRMVANCHKIPAAEFERKLLSVQEIVSDYLSLIESLTKLNPQLKFIFTVSPVRHWKDGAVGNQISKSVLILAIHKLIELLAGKAQYFPAYELLLDDLRDYRFYEEDLLHPAKNAVDYIWDKFSGVYFDKITEEIIKEISLLIAASRHKPFNEGTSAWKAFLENNLKKTETLSKKYPFLDLSIYYSRFSLSLP